MDLASTIRAAIAAAHTAIEATPLSREMIAGKVDRAIYLELLAQLEAIHGPLEERLRQLPADLAVFEAGMARSEILRRDLATLGGDGTSLPCPETENLIEMIRTGSDAELIGLLYVFEGSRMGSMFLSKTVARALGVPPLPGHGLDYHLEGMTTRPADWQRFRGRINALTLDESDRHALVAAAVHTMDHLHRLYETLSTAPVGGRA